MSTAWIQTNSGRAFDLFDPQPDQVCIEDIAWHLSQICRFTGAPRRFYSVAEHSWEMSQKIETNDLSIKLAALLHDAHEAYLGDIATPLGQCMTLTDPHGDPGLPRRLAELKDAAQRAIHYALGIPVELIDHPLIKGADLRLLATEKRDLMAREPRPWIKLPKPYERSLQGEWQWDWSKVFLQRFDKLQTLISESVK